MIPVCCSSTSSRKINLLTSICPYGVRMHWLSIQQSSSPSPVQQNIATNSKSGSVSINQHAKYQPPPPPLPGHSPTSHLASKRITGRRRGDAGQWKTTTRYEPARAHYWIEGKCEVDSPTSLAQALGELRVARPSLGLDARNSKVPLTTLGLVDANIRARPSPAER